MKTNTKKIKISTKRLLIIRALASFSSIVYCYYAGGVVDDLMKGIYPNSYIFYTYTISTIISIIMTFEFYTDEDEGKAEYFDIYNKKGEIIGYINKQEINKGGN